MEDIKSSFQILVDVQDWSNIATSVAVVRSRPYGDQVLVSEPIFETIHHKLMGSSNQLQIVDMVELSGHSGTK